MSARAPVIRAAFDGSDAAYRGMEMLCTAVLVIDFDGRLMWANQAAETVFESSRRILLRQPVSRMFVEEALVAQLVADARASAYGQRRQMLTARRASHESVQLHAVASVLSSDDTPLLIELTEVEQQLRVERGERQSELPEANRRLLRNLAHEIKNPLGGIRGAAQLLDSELVSAEQREYTRVIIHEADRLQALVDRVLAPHRMPRVVASVNMHEVFERVRSVILAEFPRGLVITRDYDASAPEVAGDREQFIQAVLNIVHNAALALEERIRLGDAQIVLRSRIARRINIARRHCRLALDLRVIDNGPGIADELKERIFHPLVSGREGGSGLGLTLAQAYIQQNDGAVEFDTKPGRTEFRILLPII